MAACSELSNCRYFNEVLVSMPTVAEMMKDRYCYGDKHQCARVQVAREVGGHHVPPDLAPNEDERGRGIIQRHRRE